MTDEQRKNTGLDQFYLPNILSVYDGAFSIAQLYV